MNQTTQHQQERDHKVWTIVELFYRSFITFREQYERYEWRVLQHSYKKGLHRLDLRLGPDDLAGLLDFKALERLRDEYIHRLKDICHQIFRDQYRTDILDRYVSDIFHEISILKEEHYTVKTYAPQYARDSAETELSHILDEAHTMFPKKLNHIRYLYRRAQERMEQILPSLTGCQILVRSLFLGRDDFVKDAYDGGVRDFYRHMYPGQGAREGFYQVGMSFFRSGFYDRALEAMRLAEREFEAQRGKDDSSTDLAARARELEEELKRHLALLVEAETAPGPAARARLAAAAGLAT